MKAKKASGEEIIKTGFNEITQFLQTHASIPDEYRNIPVSTINNMLIEYLSKNNKIDDKDIDDFLHREEVKNANTFKLDDRKYKDSIRKYIEENSVKWKEIITDIEITCQLPEYMQGITIIDSPGVGAGGNVGRITEDYKENADAIIFIKSLVAGALESDSFTKLINNEITKKQKDFLFLVFTGKCRGLSDAGFKELRPKAIDMYKSRIDERKILFVDSKIHLFLNKCLELRTKEKIDKFFNEENNKFAEAKLCWLESEKDFRKFEDNMAEKSDFRSVKIAIEKFAQKTNYLQLKAFLENLKKSYFEYKDIFSKSLKIAEENKNDPIELENKINRKLEEINDTLKKMNDGIRDIGKEYIGKGENYGKIKNEIEIEKKKYKEGLSNFKEFNEMKNNTMNIIDKFKDFRKEKTNEIIKECDKKLIEYSNSQSEINAEEFTPNFTEADFDSIEKSAKKEATEIIDKYECFEKKRINKFHEDRYVEAIKNHISNDIDNITLD